MMRTKFTLTDARPSAPEHRAHCFANTTPPCAHLRSKYANSVCTHNSIVHTLVQWRVQTRCTQTTNIATTYPSCPDWVFFLSPMMDGQLLIEAFSTFQGRQRTLDGGQFYLCVWSSGGNPAQCSIVGENPPHHRCKTLTSSLYILTVSLQYLSVCKSTFAVVVYQRQHQHERSRVLAKPLYPQNQQLMFDGGCLWLPLLPLHL